MKLARAVPFTVVSVGLVAGLLAVGLLSLVSPAGALPPAGVDILNVTAEVSATSRLGQETFMLSGTIELDRSEPRMDGDVEVVDITVLSIDLSGESVTGPVTVSTRETITSVGEIRSLQPPPDQFPASSVINVLVDIAVPASPSRTNPLVLNNDVAFHLRPFFDGEEVPLESWPPVGVTFQDVPEPCVPLLPTQPAEICVTSVSITVGDAKTPTPTLTPCPIDICTPTATVAPEATMTATPPATPTSGPLPAGPSFSVAPNGPSGLGAGDLLTVGGGSLPPIANDDFVDAIDIASLPYEARLSTEGATTEVGEPDNPLDCITFSPAFKGATAWFSYTAPALGTVTAETTGSDYDTVLAVYTGSAVNALAPIACDDDSGPGLQSELTIPVQGGTTYHFQVGGYRGRTGALVFSLSSDDGSVSGAPAFGGLTCEALGLTVDGCDASDGDEDDVDALSYGAKFPETGRPISFSVGPGSTGLPGSAVAAQAACSPPQPQADEFSSLLLGSNALERDGDGLGDGCPTDEAVGLVEVPTSDDLDALENDSLALVDPNGDGTLDDAVFFSLAAGSPTLVQQGRGPADVLWTVGFQPAVYVSAADLGLQDGDDIDALCLADQGDGAIYSAAEDFLLFSLAAGSPTLTQLGAGPADVLAPGPAIFVEAADIGLQPADELNALACAAGIGDTEKTTVSVGDIFFCGPAFEGEVCDRVIEIGDTVTWDFSAADLAHTVTECGDDCDNPTESPFFDSGLVSDGSSYEFTFNQAGTYVYYCAVHPDLQRGRIIVLGAGPTPTPTPAGPAGDVDCSGSVSSIDVALVLQLVGGLIDELSCEQNGDVDDRGGITSIDASLMLQFIAGLIDDLPP